MDFVSPRGDRNSPIIFIGYAPSEQDEAKGTVFMDGNGWFLDRMIRDADLPIPYFFTFQPTAKQLLPEQLCLQALVQSLQLLKPKFIVTCDSRPNKGERTKSDVLLQLCPETDGDLDKYAGSLLESKLLDWPHYIMPIQSPAYIQQNYAERDITVSLDLGKLREEYLYFKKTGQLQPLPERQLICEPKFPELMDFFKNECRKAKYIAADIETIRPPKKKDQGTESSFHNFPGMPYTNSFAVSPKLGISYSLWDYTIEELIAIFREMDWLLRNVPQIGQNYFLFDIIFLEALGYRPNIRICQDLIIRHHILWPELPHSLQFQTRQYTRQPYYKDEGKNWKPSEKRKLLHYGCLDTTVTYEIFEAQEEEFKDRSWLKDDETISNWLKSKQSNVTV